MVLHSAGCIRRGAKEVAELEWDWGRDVAHTSSRAVGVPEINADDGILPHIVLRQERVCPGRHIIMIGLKFFDLKA